MERCDFMICFFLAIILFTGFIPALAQNESWQVNYFEDFDDNAFGWPLGMDIAGTTTAERSIRNSSYVWNVTSSDPNVLWMGLNLPYPGNTSRHRFTAEIKLPDFDPLACAGLMLGNDGSSFYGYVICNDKTYSLIHSANGNVETLIPYSQIKDYDSFSASLITAELNNGWVDLYFNDETLDTYYLGATGGSFGLIAMPQTTQTTEIDFNVLLFQSTADAQETTFDANAVDPAATDNIGRMVKMLNMKERISSTSGRYLSLPDHEMSLAMMGYASKAELDISGGNLLLQSDISWSSGYERPDYSNSGCGFYIREAGSDSYIEIWAAMDGGIYVNAFRYGNLVPLIALKYGTWSIEGSGRLAVAADGRNITILWNDSILGTVTDATWIGEGKAGYIVHSGTNGDFGTRCVFSNGEGYLFSEE